MGMHDRDWYKNRNNDNSSSGKSVNYGVSKKSIKMNYHRPDSSTSSNSPVFTFLFYTFLFFGFLFVSLRYFL